jgi:hypothetical protein
VLSIGSQQRGVVIVPVAAAFNDFLALFVEVTAGLFEVFDSVFEAVGA